MGLNLAALATIKTRLAAAIQDEAQAILANSNGRIPRDTDTAMLSGRVLVDQDTTYITYGLDTDSNPKTHASSNTYIAELHENMAVQHRTGEAKFLQHAADDAHNGILARVAAKAKV